MQALIKVLTYEGNNVTFKTQDGITYVNATEMAKPFGKLVADYVRLSSTNELACAHMKINSTMGNPIVVINGGNDRGTWMHEDIALDFAQWLSVDFRIWCNARIKELMTTGSTHIPSPKDLALMVIRAEEEKEAMQNQIKIDAPKVLFANSVCESKDSVLIKELATYLNQNGIDIGQNRLFTWLRDNEYLCKKGEYYNLPTQRALELKLFEVKKTAINKPDGTILTSSTTKVTGKGLVYFLNKFLKQQKAA